MYVTRNTDRAKHRLREGSAVNHARQLKNANFENTFGHGRYSTHGWKDKKNKRKK